jgi:hypothetical protein
MKIEVSNGELLDKLSILEVKSLKLKDETKLKYVRKEYKCLKESVDSLEFSLDDPTYTKLRDINFHLWDIEDAVRGKEILNQFDEEFIELSRLIYTQNDERFRLKNLLNKKTNSEFQEQKGHKNT